MALKELKQASRTTGRFTNITDEDIERADDEFERKGELDFGFGNPEDNPSKDKKQKAMDGLDPYRSWKR
jgi:hypothetical protein